MLAPCVDIGTGGQQCGDCGGIGDTVKRGPTHAAARVDVRSRLQQQGQDRGPSKGCRNVQRGLVQLVARVGVGARFEQEGRGGRIRTCGRTMQERLAAAAQGVDVVAAGQAIAHRFDGGRHLEPRLVPVLARGGMSDFAEVVLRKGIRPEIQQLPDNRGVPLPPTESPRGVQGCVAAVVPHVHLRPRGHQRNDHGFLASFCRFVQRGPSCRCPRVDIRPGFDQERNGGGIVAVFGRRVQRDPAIPVPCIRIRPGSQQGGNEGRGADRRCVRNCSVRPWRGVLSGGSREGGAQRLRVRLQRLASGRSQISLVGLPYCLAVS